MEAITGLYPIKEGSVRIVDDDGKETELAGKLNMTQRKISYIECGKCEPSLEDIIAFCKYFKVSSDYLLGLSKNEK